MLLLDRSAVWETMNEAIKITNSVESFTGEDSQLHFRLAVKGGPNYVSVETVPELTLENIFKRLADFDYEKSVEAANGLKRDATRAPATLAVTRTVLEANNK